MSRLAVLGVVVVVVELVAILHVRTLARAEQYALGHLLRRERALAAEAARLRARWAEATDPERLLVRAEALGLQLPEPRQVLR